MKLFKHFLIICVILLSPATQASDRNPLITKITRISMSNPDTGAVINSEYYAVKIHASIDDRPSLTALFYMTHTPYPELIVAPCSHGFEKKKYLTEIINALPIIQQESAGKVFKKTYLSTHKRNRVALCSILGNNPRKKRGCHYCVAHIKAEDLPVTLNRQNQTIDFLFEMPKKNINFLFEIPKR